MGGWHDKFYYMDTFCPQSTLPVAENMAIRFIVGVDLSRVCENWKHVIVYDKNVWMYFSCSVSQGTGNLMTLILKRDGKTTFCTR